MRSWILLFALLGLLFLPSLAQAAVPELTVKAISPQPVEPGKNVTVVINIENKEGKSTTFDFSLAATAPFTLLSQKDSTSGPITVCGFCTRQNTYVFAVSPNAASGTYELQMKGVQGTFAVTVPVVIEVRGNPNLIISSNPPAALVAGKPFPLTIEITNIGTALATEIAVSPSSSNFIPLGGATQTITQLSPGASADVTFTLLVGDNVAPNVYALPMNISYVDESGTKKSVTSNIGLQVINAAELALQSVKIATQSGSTTITSADAFTIIARVENVGEGKANFITADSDCSFDGARKAYLGSLDEGEDAPAVFDFLPAPAGTHTCTVTVSYADDQGEHSFSEAISVRVSPADITGSVIPVVIILLVIGYLLYRRRRHTKRHGA